jgi:hypothetical protein
VLCGPHYFFFSFEALVLQGQGKIWVAPKQVFQATRPYPQQKLQEESNSDAHRLSENDTFCVINTTAAGFKAE